MLIPPVVPFVCTANMCRSPMAEAILKSKTLEYESITLILTMQRSHREALRAESSGFAARMGLFCEVARGVYGVEGTVLGADFQAKAYKTDKLLTGSMGKVIGLAGEKSAQ
jgi:predicted protein tyrosine phosphatase